MPDHYSRILEQLNTLTLANGSTAQTIEQVTDPIHIEAGNLQALRDVVLINSATMRNAGQPIPGTGQVKETLITDGETGHKDVFIPEAGEVWLITTVSAKPTATGTINLSMSLEDSTSGARAVLDTGTGNATTAVIIDMVNGPVYVSKECFLQAYIGTNSGGCTFDIACHRVR
jgi:hypothetical protein